LPCSRRYLSAKLPNAGYRSEAENVRGIGKPGPATLLRLDLVSAAMPKLLPRMGPTLGTAVKIMIDLWTGSGSRQD
jgi:hypothetical protein